jgi:hypothetical protein
MMSSALVRVPSFPPSVYRDLAKLSQWLYWKREPSENGKITKVPYDPNISNGHERRASSKIAGSWSTFETATAAALRHGGDGLGFVVTDQDPFTGIDLDNCRNPETGEIKPWAQELIDKLNSYTEKSPSGTGLHTFVEGDTPDGSRCKVAYEDGKVEIYSRKRYFTMTGDHLKGTPPSIEKRQDQLQAVHEKVFGPPKEKSKQPTAPSSTALLGLTDAKLLEKIRSSRQRDKFDRLWAGDTSEHGGDDSAADLALCGILAFWTGRNEARMDQLFRQSGLMRDKWERQDYRDGTITKACESTVETYSPHKARTEIEAHRNGASAAAIREPETQAEADARNGSGAIAVLQEPDLDKLAELPLDALVEQGDDIEQVEPDSQPEPVDDSLDEQEQDLKPEPSATRGAYPKPIGEAGYYGVIGEIVNIFAPHTEADPNFLLVSLLVAAGNYLGRNAYVEVSSAKHYANLFVCGVGPSGIARKGTAINNTHRFLMMLEDEYCAEETSCIEWSSLSSGEGIISRIKDPVYKPAKGSKEQELEDPGRSDKRLLSMQEEFGPALQNMKRIGNNLSGTLRTAWDGKTLGSLTKNAYRATDPHVSMITSTTGEELIVGIEPELTSGLANRFLWCCSIQSKKLPEGGALDETVLQPYAAHFINARRYAASAGRVKRDGGANDEWGTNDHPNPSQTLYAQLDKLRVGKFAKCVTRAHVMVLRMALIYALLDFHTDKDGDLVPHEIRTEHLLAAAEVWRYCEDSARYIFGESTGHEMADAILKHLRSIDPQWSSLTDIRQKVFRNNKPAEAIKAALSHLLHDYQPPLIEHREVTKPKAKKPTQYYRRA